MENKKTVRKVSSSSENSSSGLLTEFDNDIRSTAQSTPAAPKPSTSSAPKRQLRRKRKRVSFPNDNEEGFDQNFEETIKTAADKNNLTPMCVKKLLKKIVVNDHVFAIVRLKEEEEAKKLRMEASNKQPQNGDGDVDDEDEKEQPEPKLTRLKAKQLKQTPFHIASLHEPTPDEEVAALIHQELSSDDDDEEYKPAEDETASDEDPNTTVSDVDSQPRTPVSTAAFMEQEHESEVQYTEDGLFKIPRPRNDSHCSQSEQEHEQENIALRTRSKLCLSTTAIETLESTFIPPDITNDMYEYDGEMDQAWKDFLEEFTKPLPNNLEDDDDNDPEYVATEGIPLDPEEMRAVKVSKKELNELVMELMEMGGTDDQMLEQTLTETINESLNCQLDDRSEMLSTPVPEIQEADCCNSAMQSALIADSSTRSEQFPSGSILPPESSTNEPVQTTQLLENTQQDYNTTAMCTSTYLPSQADPNISTVPYNASTVMEAAVPCSDASMPTSSAEVYDPNVSAEQAFLPDGTPKPNFVLKCVYLQEVPLEGDSLPCTVDHTNDNHQKRYRVQSLTVPIDVEISNTELGLNDIQLQLLQQQLRMHVQLTTQHFLQTYQHPIFDSMASTFRNMLTELEDIGKMKPTIVPWNLPLALECCQSWEKKMAKNGYATKSLKRYWNEEMDRDKERSKHNHVYRSELHWLVKETILNSKAFIYPSLIPWKAFRNFRQPHSHYKYIAERRLIAIFLERASNELKKLQTKNDKPSLARICAYVVKHFCPWRTIHGLKSLLYKYRPVPDKPLDPTGYFIKNGYAPPFDHVLEMFDPGNILFLSQYDKGTLHFNWENDLFSKNKSRHRKTRITTPTKQLNVPNESSQSPVSETTPKESDLLINVAVLLPVEPGKATNSRNDGISLPKSENPTINQVNNDTQRTDVVAVPYANFVVNIANADAIKNTSSNIYAESEVFNEVINVETYEPSQTCRGEENLENSGSVISGCKSDGKRTKSKSIQANRHRSNATDAAAQECTSLEGQIVGKVAEQQGSYSRSAAVATLYSAMKRYLQVLKNESKQEFAAACRSQANGPILRVYAHFKQLEIYSRFLDELRKMSENCATYEYKPLPQCYFSQPAVGLLRLSCSHRADGSLIIGAEYITDRFDDYQSMDDKDAIYAFNYYEKVEETLLASDRTDLLERFEQILRNFDEIEDRVASLYCQIEDLLGENFPELVDAFLTFLLPGQAAEVGKFFEHFILTNMDDFLEKLNVFFAKQPSQIKKIHACLNELSNDPEVTMDQVKMKVLPLLKGSTLLMEWFLQLFPGERPPESPISDYEHIAMKKYPVNDSCDAGSVYEHISYIETLPDGPENPCASNGIRYIQGRIFQGALPARLTFLANSCVTKAANQTTKDVATNGENLCDDSTLMAHAIRLNPLVHCPKGMTYANVAHLLVENKGDPEVGTSPEISIASTNAEDGDGKTGTTSKKLTPKLPLKKRFNSPISRKAGISPGDERSSPGGSNREATTPKKLTTAASLIIPPDSKALVAARKMRTLLDTPQTSSQEEPQLDDPCQIEQHCNAKERLEAPKQSLATTEAANCSAHVETQEEPKPSKETKRTEEAPSWTREEDKIILQDIVKGFSSVDTFVKQIGQKIPDRSSDQIRDRFEFLHRMLRQVNQK